MFGRRALRMACKRLYVLAAMAVKEAWTGAFRLAMYDNSNRFATLG